jgi:hypothetical protein
MERLRDQIRADDPGVAELARMIRAVDLAPLPGAQDRVRAALAERPARRTWRQPVLVVVVLLIALPAAVAATRLVWVAAARDIPSDEPAMPVERPDPAAASHTRSAHAAMPSASAIAEPADAGSAEIAAVAAPVPGDAAAVEPAVVEEPARRSPRPLPPPRAGARLTPPPTAAVNAPEPPGNPLPIDASDAPPLPVAGPDEAGLVLGALQALRRDRDLPGALRRLDDYRARFPHGDLIEEALALTLEALAGLDDPRARSIADEYLASFPHGRFRDQAERARRRFAGRP